MNVRTIIGGIQVFGWVLFGLVAVTLVFPLLTLAKRGPLRQAELRRWWFRRIANALRLDISAEGCWSNKPVLLVANHISWLDIVALGATTRCVFLAKDDVAKWPVIGTLARRAGTRFIERGNRRSASQSISNMARVVDQGLTVGVFPEGTSTDGSQVLRFHSMLFAIAAQTGIDVQPVAVAYRDQNGEQSDVAPFIGDDEFFSHLMRVLRAPKISVQLDYLPLIAAEGRSRRELAELSQHAIAHSAPVILTPALENAA